MFKKEYQGGKSVDVFSAQGRDPVQQWRLTGSVKKDFDKSVRGYVYVLEGGASTTTTRMTLPKSDKSSLCLVQPCCVLQLLVSDSAKLVVDLSVMDNGGNRRRLHLSTSQRQVCATTLNTRLPLPGLLTGQWLNLCVDMGSLVQSVFKGVSFKSLEALSLGGSCKLRRVFTLQTTPTSSDLLEIPALHMNSVLLQTVIIGPQSLVGIESKSGRGGGGSGESHSRTSSKATHVAFGKKVVIPDHVLTSRQASGDARGRAIKLEGMIEPSPPSNPPNQSCVKFQRARVSMVSTRSCKQSTAPGIMQVHCVGSVVSPRQSSVVIITPPSSPVRTTPQQQQRRGSRSHTLASNEELGVQVPTKGKQFGGQGFMCDEEEESPGEEHVLTSDEVLALTVLQDMQAGPNEVVSGHKEVISRQEEVVSGDDEFVLEGDKDRAVGDVDEGTGQVYSYTSLPRSAERRVPALGTAEGSSSRGAKLEEDFLSPKDSPSHHFSQTRLSDDYDWRQYASADDQALSEDVSLRTRLASDYPHHVHARATTTSLDDTLSESITPSSGTEQFKNVRHSSFLDSLDTSGMGGMLSPAPVEEWAARREAEDVLGHGGRGGGEDDLELMYDPQLNCFYDPITSKYYELIQPN